MVHSELPGGARPQRGGNIALAGALADGIERGQIEAWFQPQIDLTTGRMAGVESLARWRHPDLGLLPPASFLSLLPLTRSTHKFTDEILRQSLAFAERTDTAGAPLNIAVNLGATSYLDSRMANSVERMLRSTRIRPERLTLELVESEVLHDSVDHRPAFEALADLGTKLSIDDFGVGYSSLRRLSMLPVHELKIDPSFVSAIFSNQMMHVIVRTILDLANALGLNSVAEGIERASEANLLQQMGCAHGQGHFFAAPLSVDLFLERFVVVDGSWRPAEGSGRIWQHNDPSGTKRIWGSGKNEIVLRDIRDHRPCGGSPSP